MKQLILMLVLTLIVLPIFAQGPGLPGGDPDEPVPIDGGMYLLMAAGMFYGIKSIRRNR
jgi:hypothetical protein